jgi:plasmid stability protein
MGQIIVRNLDDPLVERLKAKARQKGQSLEQTVRDILREAARPCRREIIEDARRIRAMMPPSSLDSTDLIREDRDNDEPHR